jgi:hypothetical protein
MFTPSPASCGARAPLSARPHSEHRYQNAQATPRPQSRVSASPHFRGFAALQLRKKKTLFSYKINQITDNYY